ncbi:MAG TPA: trypsin-like peptidase domain-containing protein [Trebonia sp.]|jgi:V8-like Glu-specific endopeptidase|nr:trypsin-like peptidase domain-containing protein [Trebonia sp.]
MALTIRNRAVTAVSGALAAAVLAAIAATSTGAATLPAAPRPAAGRGPGAVAAHAAARTTRAQSAAGQYWTPARMAAAVPADALAVTAPQTAARPSAASREAWLDGNSLGAGLRWAHGGAVQRTLGKVFFTLNGMNYVCSGAAIKSPRAEMVLTAAHCANDGDGHWAANWTFVPGYAGGGEPYGSYTARRFYVPARWSGATDGSAQSEEYDVAFVTVNPAALSGTPTGARADQLTGGQAVAFGSAPAGGFPAYVFGYPSEPPYSGQYANYCAGQALPASPGGTAQLHCGMTAGDSGGPWFADFNPRTGTGTIVAVTTYKFSDDSSVLYGTELGAGARALYDEASASPAG